MFRKWARDQRGSVSLFLIIMLAFIFTFVAVFIDYARIAAMKVQTERLLRASLRSVMSAYEPELQQQYGLFAFGDNNGDQIMADVLNGSMVHGVRSDAFALLPLQLDTSSLSMERMIGEYDIFNQQIQEEMKYKAPIDYTLEIMNKFKPLSSSMQEASNTVDVLSKLQKLYDRREAALDAMIQQQERAAQTTTSLPELIMSPGGSSLPNQSLGDGVTSAGSSAAQYDDYVAKHYEDEERRREWEADRAERLRNHNPLDDWIEIFFQPLYAGMIQRYHSDSRNVLNKLSDKQSAMSNRQPSFDEALQQWQTAYNLNEQMKRVIEESRNRSSNAGYETVAQDGGTGSLPESTDVDMEELRKVREKVEELLLPEELFEDLKTEIENQAQQHRKLAGELSSLNSVMSGVFSTGSSSGPMKSQAIKTRATADEYTKNYVAAGSANRIQLEKQWVEARRSADGERKQKEKESKAKLKDASKILEAINGLDDKARGHMDVYKTLQGYYDASIAFNNQPAGGSTQGADLDDDPYDAGKSAMNDVDDAYGSMAGVLVGLRDELYQNEYAAQYFPHFDIKELGAIVTNPDADMGDALVDQLSVHNQELEYILYGFHNPVGNISAAYAEIFGVRLAVRTMEALVDNAKMGNPLLILAAALLQGITMAIADMVTLCTTGSVELSKYVKVKLTYKDYLRLFLFVHSNNEKKMSRMLALIQLNTGINPAERGTYASGEVRVGMNLWFLPGLMKMVGFVSSTPDQVEGSRYYAIKKADFSY